MSREFKVWSVTWSIWIILTVLSIHVGNNAEAGWCDWLKCGTECEEKLAKAEKDKLWLWDQLVACRNQLPPKPYPQPSTYKEVHINDIHRIFQSRGINADIIRGDVQYKTIPRADFEGWLAYNPISEKRYLAPGMDCDDFAQQTVVAAKQWFPSIAIAEVWGVKKADPDYNHAFIAHIDIDGELSFYEPQDDGMRRVEDWDVYFIKFEVKE